MISIPSRGPMNVSSTSMSVVNLLMIRPMGVESNNHIGHLRTFLRSFLYRWVEAFNRPMKRAKFPNMLDTAGLETIVTYSYLYGLCVNVFARGRYQSQSLSKMSLVFIFSGALSCDRHKVVDSQDGLPLPFLQFLASECLLLANRSTPLDLMRNEHSLFNLAFGICKAITVLLRVLCRVGSAFAVSGEKCILKEYLIYKK